MSKSKLLPFLSIMAALIGHSTPEEKIERKPKKKLTEDEIAESKGLKKFFYGKNYVWALNKKNADRKAKNLGFVILREMTEDEIAMFVMLNKMDNAKSKEVFELLVKKGGWQLEGIKKRFSAYNLSADNKTMIMIFTISNGVIGKCAKYVDDVVVRSAKLNINEISFDDFSKRIYPIGYPSF